MLFKILIFPFNKSKSGNGTEVTLNLSSNVIGGSNDETNIWHKLLTDRQVSRAHKAFVNNSSANIKLSKTQLSKIVQSEGVLGRLLGSLLKTGFPLMKVLKPLAKSVFNTIKVNSSSSSSTRCRNT